MRQRAALAALGLITVLGSTTPRAQWLDYKTPGLPRTADGKVKLDAPAPRAPDGHPDLTGVWMHEPTTVAEVRKLFGPVEERLKVDAPGMELGTQHKYGFNILIDFKPEASPMTPGAVALMAKRRSAPPEGG